MNILKFTFLTLVFAFKTNATPVKHCPALFVSTKLTELKKQVKDLIDQERENDGLVGISYSVISGKQGLLFSGASGSPRLGPTEKINPQSTLFRLASTSKLILSLGLARLIEDGAIDLNTKIVSLTHVPFIKKLQSSGINLSRWNQITIGHLASHQAGISKDLPGIRLFWDSEPLQDNKYPTLEEFTKGITEVETLFTPGQLP